MNLLLTSTGFCNLPSGAHSFVPAFKHSLPSLRSHPSNPPISSQLLSGSPLSSTSPWFPSSFGGSLSFINALQSSPHRYCILLHYKKSRCHLRHRHPCHFDIRHRLRCHRDDQDLFILCLNHSSLNKNQDDPTHSLYRGNPWLASKNRYADRRCGPIARS